MILASQYISFWILCSLVFAFNSEIEAHSLDPDENVITQNLAENSTMSRASRIPEAELIKYLLRDYDIDARPVSNPAQRVVVTVELWINTVLDLVRKTLIV